MKRILAALTLCLASVIAFAAPSPKQIEAALAARDYASAKTMITQVLAERPDSARAHLMKAYVLAAADKNKEAAKSELAIAKTLDKDGSVTNSPLFGRTVGAIDNIAVAAALPPPRPTSFAPPPAVQAPPVAQAPAYVAPKPVAVAKKDEGHGFGFWFFITLLVAGGVGGVVYLISRKPKEVVVPSYAPSYSSPTPRETDFNVNHDEALASVRRADPAPAPRYTPPPAPAYRAPAYQETHVHHHHDSGMSTGAAVAAGVGVGVVGTLIVDNAIENARLRNRVDNLERERFSSGTSNGWGYTTSPAPAPAPVEDRVDYESEAQSFSSGKTDTWAPAPAPAAWAPSPAPAADTWSSGNNDTWSDPPAAAPADDNNW